MKFVTDPKKSGRRNFTSANFCQLLGAFENGDMHEIVPDSGDPDLDTEIRRTAMLIRHLYSTWPAWLDGREPIPAQPLVPTDLVTRPSKFGDAVAA